MWVCFILFIVVIIDLLIPKFIIYVCICKMMNFKNTVVLFDVCSLLIPKFSNTLGRK